MPINDHDLIQLRGAARDVQMIAELHGYTLPDEATTALEMSKEAKRIALGVGTTSTPDPQPTKPAAIAKWISAEANRRLGQREEEQVANQLAETLDRNALRLTLDCARSVADHIVSGFPAIAEQFTTSAPFAPAEVTGNTTPDEFAAFASAAQAADSLTRSALHRARLAEVLHEEAVTQAPLWLVLAPGSASSLFAVTALLKDLDKQVPRTAEQWRRAFAIGVQLAAPGEAERRMGTYSQALFSSGMAVDGGMLDKTYAEALGSENAAGALIAGQVGMRSEW